VERILNGLMDFLYGSVRQEMKIAIADLRTHLSATPENDLDTAIGLLAAKDLIRLSLNRDSVVLCTVGKTTYEKGCVVEVCLGTRYILATYRSAIVRISVIDRDGDPAGATGFFVADFPGWLGTAGHVVEEGFEIVDVRDEAGNVVGAENLDVRRISVANIDLALVRCQIPAGVTPLRIEWDGTVARELDEVVVAGYPHISFHNPTLVVSRGEIASFPLLRSAERRSLMISRVTEPGFSGAPVIDTRGLVIGVVEQENVLTDKQGNRSIFVTATPAHHFLTFKP
jgi:S1-C subfamily serine protease